MNKLSHSACKIYNDCGRKYDLHYNYRLRSKNIGSALIFGSAIDIALNHLLETNNLEESYKVFDKAFTFQDINREPTYLPTSEKIVYSQRDFDGELLKGEDTALIVETYRNLSEAKQTRELTLAEKKQYNYYNWLSLQAKAYIMLESYYKKVLPNINRVIAVQKRGFLDNDQGDKVEYILDLVADWKDGKRYLLDNKTSSILYERDSASKSQQLVLYYHAEKEALNLDAVGFIVLNKSIRKNRVKICKQCGFDGSGARYRTCQNSLDNKRCDGEWTETINPDCRIDIILNDVSRDIEDKVLDTFDNTNLGIKNKEFNPNWKACKIGGLICPYYKKCNENDDSDLIVLPKREENIVDKK